MSEKVSGQSRAKLSVESRAVKVVGGSGLMRLLPMLPGLLFVFVVGQGLGIMTIYYSLLDWNVLLPGSKHFVGFSNYLALAGQPAMRSAVINSVVLVVSVVFLCVLCGTALALLLERRFLGHGVARTLLITPFLFMSIAATMAFKNGIYGVETGLLNRLLQLAGIAPLAWTQSFPMESVVLLLVWEYTPLVMLIVLAGLQVQERELWRAAEVDGATPWQRYRYIIVPQLRPYMELGSVFCALYVIQVFGQIFALTGGGPGTATMNLPFEVYLLGFQQFSFGQASAAAVVIGFLSLTIMVIILRRVSSLLRGGERYG